MLALVLVSILPAIAVAQPYRCNVNGKMVYSQTRCAEDADALHIDPVPSDSLDNPEVAERYRLQKEEQAYQQAVQEGIQRQELQRMEEQAARRKAEEAMLQSEVERKQHEAVVEQKLDGINRELKRSRIQQSIDAEMTRQTINNQSSGAGINSHTTCRPNVMGTQLDCDRY